jgi:type IV pilus assembly protein PilA
MNTKLRNALHTTNEEGFSLIELLIVMSIMLILMTLAIPQLLKVRKTAAETSAMASMKAIGQAEIQYSSAYPQNGFSCSLASMGGSPGSAPSAQSAQVLDPTLAGGQKQGYTFAITNCTKVTVNNQDMFTGYEITAVPNSVGRSGDSGFCMDENNILKKDPAGGTNCTVTLQ